MFAADMNMDGSVDVLVTSTLPSSQLAWCVAWPGTAGISRTYSTVFQRSTGRFVEDLPFKTGLVTSKASEREKEGGGVGGELVVPF